MWRLEVLNLGWRRRMEQVPLLSILGQVSLLCLRRCCILSSAAASPCCQGSTVAAGRFSRRAASWSYALRRPALPLSHVARWLGGGAQQGNGERKKWTPSDIMKEENQREKERGGTRHRASTTGVNRNIDKSRKANAACC